MRMQSIRPGDHVEVDVKGIVFEAIVRSKAPRVIGVDPIDPIRHTWRYVSARQIKRRISRPEVSAREAL
jgi:hypothetical protein